MYNGERPIGAAKGKQPNTEALCHPPPPPQSVGEDEGYNRENLVRPFLVHNRLGPRPPRSPVYRL